MVPGVAPSEVKGLESWPTDRDMVICYCSFVVCILESRHAISVLLVCGGRCEYSSLSRTIFSHALADQNVGQRESCELRGGENLFGARSILPLSPNNEHEYAKLQPKSHL